MNLSIRPVMPEDVPVLKEVIDSSGLFPPELLDPMIADFLAGEASQDIWLTAEENGRPVAVAYCIPERMTVGTHNLLLIAVHGDWQGKGIGSKLMTYVEQLLMDQDSRILLVETSGLPEFSLTRKFYDRLGYTREAVIRDFYDRGENKIIFWKALE